MFRRRGSFKVGTGVRMNYGRRGVTSVTVAGVNIGLGSRSGGSSRPTKSEILASQWRLRPGFFDVRIELTENETINLVVNGGEITYSRMKRIMEGLYDQNSEAVARAFKTFVRAWDVTDEHGNLLPINKGGVEFLGIDMIFGLAIEVANALNIPKEPLGHVLKHRDSGEPLKIIVTEKTPLSSTPTGPLATSESSVNHEGGEKSTKVTYLLWLLFGLFGGHRYYLGRTGTGLLQTFTLGGVGIWWLLDAFLVPGMVKATNTERRVTVLDE